MALFENETLTARESILMENERDENRLIREHAEAMKKLDIEFQRQKLQADVELRELDIRLANWFRIPLLIIKLPVLIVLGFGFIVGMARGTEPSKRFWDLLK